MMSAAKKNMAALSSVTWSGLLTTLKLVVGLATGSLGIMSEALHSLLDLLAAAGTLFAVRLAAKPADQDHPYGHGKIESLMALAEVLLLLATAAWVIREASIRLASDDPSALHIDLTPWAFIVIIISLVVDINRSTMLRRIARETKSPALEADAAHFSSDILSSAAVLVGISTAALADSATPGTFLHWILQRADVFSSLVVALIILRICAVLGSKAVNNLMDKTDPALQRHIEQLMSERMSAYPLRHLRFRTVGDRTYIEMTVGMPRELHIDTAHEVADAIESLVAAHISGAETIVHMQPETIVPDSPQLIIRQIALAHRMGVHSLHLIHADQGLVVFTDLELPKGATLETWHLPIQTFRAEVRRHLAAEEVYVHIEPDVRTLPEFDLPVPEDWESQVRRAMEKLNAPAPSRIALYTQGKRRICFICIPSSQKLSIAQSHEQLTRLNAQLSSILPAIAHLVVVFE